MIAIAHHNTVQHSPLPHHSMAGVLPTLSCFLLVRSLHSLCIEVARGLQVSNFVGLSAESPAQPTQQVEADGHELAFWGGASSRAAQVCESM